MIAVYNLLTAAITLYVYALILSAVLSWLVAFNIINTQNRFIYVVGDFLHRVTEPALRPIRRFVPFLGGIDLSPIILILALFFVRDLLHDILL